MGQGSLRNALSAIAALGLGCLAPAAALAQADPTPTAAKAPAPRSDVEQRLDSSRRPAEVLAFFGLKQGDVAAEFLAGDGYYAKVMAPLVGASGKVVAYNPPFFVQHEGELRTWADLVSQPDNIELQLQGYSDFAANDNSFDFALMHLVYHDVYFESAQYGMLRTDPDVFLAKLYRAMKPGGVVGVVDHVGLPGDTRAIVEATHRIDPATVKADFARAGFVLVATSDLLAKPGDDYRVNVFDPAVRGMTDRFMFKFMKAPSPVQGTR
jgi:predicted methyltransferase